MSDDVRADLVRDGRAYGRARRTFEQRREALGETIKRAAAEGLKPSEIIRLIGHELTERTLFRILGKTDA